MALRMSYLTRNSFGGFLLHRGLVSSWTFDYGQSRPLHRLTSDVRAKKHSLPQSDPCYPCGRRPNKETGITTFAIASRYMVKPWTVLARLGRRDCNKH